MIPILVIAVPILLAGVFSPDDRISAAEPPTSISRIAERHATEDAEIDSTQDPLERVDRRLDAAASSFQTDLPARIRTRLFWTPLDPTLVVKAESALARVRGLIDDSLTDLLLVDRPGRDRRVARAAAIEAAAALLEGRLRRSTIAKSKAEIQRIHRELGDVVERTSELDGPVLLILATAAATAGEDRPARSAATLLGRAAATPRGIDAVEFELVRRLNDAGGVDADRQVTIAGMMIREPRPPADRLLIAAILLEARRQTGGPDSRLGHLTLLDALTAPDTDATDRPRLTRGLAGIAADAVDPSAAIESISPLAALGHSMRSGKAGDPSAALRFATRACQTNIVDIAAEAQLERANLLLRSGDRVGAMNALVVLCRKAPSHPSAERGATIAARLAASGSSDADHARVVDQLVKIMPSHPERDDWMISVGDRAARIGDEATARAAWSSIDDHSELGPQTLVRLAGLRNPGVDDVTMLQRLEMIDDELSNDPFHPLRLAADIARVRLLLRLDRNTSAADVAVRWLEFENIPVDSRLDVAALCIAALQRSGREAEAATFFENLQTIDASLAERLTRKERETAVSDVIAAIDEDDLVTATRIARGLISITPDATVGSDWIDAADSATLLDWSWLFAAADRPEDASRLLRRILADRPDAADALMLEAILQGGRLSMRPDSTRPRSDPARAEAALRTLARITAGTGRNEQIWWRCEIERLEILHLLGRSLDRIAPRIDRLRAEHGDLGSEAFRGRFNRLRTRLNQSTR